MLAIARGLMARPRVLMLDEPSLGLAPKLVEGLYDLLAELRDEGVTILLVDQAAVMALSVADRAYVLQSGRIVHSGAAADMRSDPALAKAYLGASHTDNEGHHGPDLAQRPADRRRAGDDRYRHHGRQDRRDPAAARGRRRDASTSAAGWSAPG